VAEKNQHVKLVAKLRCKHCFWQSKIPGFWTQDVTTDTVPKQDSNKQIYKQTNARYQFKHIITILAMIIEQVSPRATISDVS